MQRLVELISTELLTDGRRWIKLCTCVPYSCHGCVPANLTEIVANNSVYVGRTWFIVDLPICLRVVMA